MTGAGGARWTTYGEAYFDTNGNLVMLTGRNGDNGQRWNEQLSAIFTKQ